MTKATSAHPLHDSCAIAGIGYTAYTRGTDKSAVELHLEAGLAAIEDAGLEPADIDGVLPYELAGLTAEDFRGATTWSKRSARYDARSSRYGRCRIVRPCSSPRRATSAKVSS